MSIPIDTTGMTDDERAAAYIYAEMIGATVDDKAGRVASPVCKQALAFPECCWGRSHGLATQVVTVEYADGPLDHYVCEHCAEDVQTGPLPEQHIDGTLVAVAPLVVLP